MTRNVPKQGIEPAARNVAALLHVEISLVADDVAKPLIPARLLDAPDLFTRYGGDQGAGLGAGAEEVAGGDLGERGRHHGGEQLVAQPGRMGRAPPLGHPGQEPGAVPLGAVGMETGIGPVHGHIAALDLAGGVRLAVRADHAPPPGGVASGGEVTGLGEPRQHVIRPVIIERDRAHGGGVSGVRGDAQRGADRLDGELALGVELGQNAGKVVPAGFEVDRSGDAKVAYRVDGATVGVASGGNGLDGGGEVASAGLFRKCVAVLVVAGASLHNPRRGQRRDLGFGTNII